MELVLQPVASEDTFVPLPLRRREALQQLLAGGGHRPPPAPSTAMLTHP
jgi:hypothetical protein